MKTRLNLLFFLMISLGLRAQNQKNMENNYDSISKGRVIKHGKVVYSEIKINASPQKVWKVFTDFESYPSWNPFIKSLKGLPIKGNKIEAFIQPPDKKGMIFKPEVLEFIAEKEFKWIGKLFISHLFDGEHTFILKDNNDGTTTFIQFERFRGILIPLMKSMLDNNTKAGFNQMNQALKERCEK